MAKVVGVIVVLLLCLTCCSCGDPGYGYLPIGWQPSSDHTWTKQFGDFEIRTRGISGLIGDRSTDPDLRIENNKLSISVKSAQLRTTTKSFAADIYGHDPIPPSKSGYHLPIDFKLESNRTIPEVLGPHCELIVDLKIGEESRQIKIEYEKKD